MFLFTLAFLNGLTLGALLFLVASGLTLSFGLMRIVNLNHGAFYLTGGYIGLSILKSTGNWPLSVLVAGLIIALLAFFEDQFLLKRFRGQSLTVTLITLSIAIIIADLDLVIWGGKPQLLDVPEIIDSPVFLFGVMYPSYRLFILIFAIIICIVLWIFLKKTKVGITIRAGIDNSEMVNALGINVEKIFTYVFVISGFLAGIAGVIGGSFSMVAPGQDWSMLIFALVTIIIGGMGSFVGSILGALITGMTFSYASAYIPELSNLFIFLPVAIIIAIRKRGLLGKELQ
ncbi:High-affinity branched-chain amino acid transport system permease protein LivH [subsurface metagenome]